MQLKEHLHQEVNKLQMEVIKSLNNVEEVKSVLGLFERMNQVIDDAPNIEVAAGEEPKKKRGRKKKEE